MPSLQERFATRLRAVRNGKEYSVNQMAQMLGMSVESYANIESGNAALSLNEVERIADLLEVEPADLLPSGFSDAIINTGENSGEYSKGNSGSTFENSGEDSGAQSGQMSGLLVQNCVAQANNDLLMKLIDRIVQLETELAKRKND